MLLIGHEPVHAGISSSGWRGQGLGYENREADDNTDQGWMQSQCLENHGEETYLCWVSLVENVQRLLED